MENYVGAILSYTGFFTVIVTTPLVYVLCVTVQQRRLQQLEQQEASETLLGLSDQTDTEPEHLEV
jgi:hypothetical protein